MLKIGGQKVPSRTLLLIGSDGVCVIVGLLLAISLRFLNLQAAMHYLHSPRTFPRFAFVILACLVSLYYNDLYNPEVIRQRTELLYRLLQSLGFSCLALAIVYYFDPDRSLGRGIAVLAAPIILLATFSWRLAMEHRGLMLTNPERVLILGTGPEGISLVREIISRPELHIKVAGFLDERGENIGKSLVNPGIIGAASDVEEVVARENIDRVILSLTERRGQTPVQQLLDLKFAGVEVADAHSVHETLSGRIFLEHLSPSWLILSDGFKKSAFLVAAKRTFDVIVSFFALLVALPIMGLVAVAVWLETGRPILFRQKRTGMWGHEFDILKFRSMVHDAEENGPTWAANDDHRITRVGQLLRKYRLDELPQMINVFRGEMSLVGPRPERPVFCQMLQENIPFFGQRHSVRPGITGWAQIKYQYGASVGEARTKLEYDLFYIKHMSLLLDIAILLETVKVILYGRGSK